MIRLALLWHQHQPCYLDLRRGEAVMPWVRLHGVKDYYGMPAILREFPGVRAHVNLVPGLILQIEAAAAGGSDPWLRLALVPAEDLRAEEKRAILETFFMAHEGNMIRVHARYAELHARARMAGSPDAVRFDTADWRDLQVWQTLAWFHPLLRASEPSVRALFAKGRGFSEADKHTLFRVQREVLAGIVPAHKAMQDSGQIEVTTTPFWHPILPLLCRMESARIAMPGVRLPAGPGLDMVEDARAQLARAVALYRDRFGRAPRGLWPSEGSVSPEMLELVEEAGFRWLATDEGVLESSLGSDFRRGVDGVPARAAELYASWRVSARVSAIFRDHALSDLVGFDYKHAEAGAAADDLIARIRRAGNAAGENALVTLALDGENAWEHYPGLGVPFLRAFYGRLQAAPDIRTVLMEEELVSDPPVRTVGKLWSGSWIDRNFRIWVGHPEDNTAWELLGLAREALMEATRAAGRDPRSRPAPAAPRSTGDVRTGGDLDLAWESLFAAEGSDWFWWYGEEHFTPLAGTFDAAFRTHLANVYAFAGKPVPAALSKPIKGRGREARAWTAPWAQLEIRVDGRRSDYYEWICAGHYHSAGDLDVMDRTESWIRDVWFGFGREDLFVRIDTDLPAAEVLAVRQLAIVFVHRDGCSVTLGAGGSVTGCRARAAAADIVEVAIPLREISDHPGELLQFYVDALSGPAVQRVPARLPFSLTVPQDGDTLVSWIV